jgi:transposase
MSIDDSLPTDLASAHALIIAQRQALSAAELRATAAESEAQYRALLIEKLKFTIGKLRHDRFGQSSERGALLDQLELQLADLEADAAMCATTDPLPAPIRRQRCSSIRVIVAVSTPSSIWQASPD